MKHDIQPYPRSKKLRVIKDGLAIDVFAPITSSGVQGIALYLNGFPDFPGQSAWTTELLRHGYVSVQPQLYGTYDSDGEFSPSGCRRSLEVVAPILTGDALKRLLPEGFPNIPARLIATSHSFGAFVLLRNIDCIPTCESVVMTGAALHYADTYGCKEDGLENLRSVRDRFPKTYRLGSEQEWRSLLVGEDALPLQPIASAGNVQIVYGSDDKYFDVPSALTNAPALVRNYISANCVHATEVEGSGHSSYEIFSYLTLKDLF